MTTKDEKTEALKNLKSWIKEGDKIYYIIRNVSTSGMYRHIGFYKFDTDEKGEISKYHLSYNMAKALDYPFKQKSCSDLSSSLLNEAKIYKHKDCSSKPK